LGFEPMTVRPQSFLWGSLRPVSRSIGWRGRIAIYMRLAARSSLGDAENDFSKVDHRPLAPTGDGRGFFVLPWLAWREARGRHRQSRSDGESSRFHEWVARLSVAVVDDPTDRAHQVTDRPKARAGPHARSVFDVPLFLPTILLGITLVLPALGVARLVGGTAVLLGRARILFGRLIR